MEKARAGNWIWIVPALPFLMLVVLVVGSNLLDHVPALVSGYDVGQVVLTAMAITWLFSVLVGIVMLLVLVILLVVGRISFKQPGVILSVVLAFLDFSLPVGLVLVILHALRSQHWWP